jgi:hypothetical protein
MMTKKIEDYTSNLKKQSFLHAFCLYLIWNDLNDNYEKI